MTRIGNPHFTKLREGEVSVQASYVCDECGWLQFAMGPADPTKLGDHSVAIRTLNNLDEDQLLWWPQVGVERHFEDVPHRIADAASEAHRCFSIQAYRATASLARAVVEATAKEKGITTGQISTKINELFKQGHIREHVKDAAHEIRYLGNQAAHGDFVDPLNTEEAAELIELMAEVLQEVFQSPARVARMRSARESRTED